MGEMFKLLMSWDVLPGSGDEYAEFISHELGPAMLNLGIRLTDAWFTLYGDRPQVLIGGITDDLEDLLESLGSEEWQAVKDKLASYVSGYRQKVVRASGEFQW